MLEIILGLIAAGLTWVIKHFKDKIDGVRALIIKADEAMKDGQLTPEEVKALIEDVKKLL